MRRSGSRFVLLLGLIGCAQPVPRRAPVEMIPPDASAHRPPRSISPDEPGALALDPAPAPAELTGVQPVDVYIRRALAENRTVQAARADVLAMKSRVPQVSALDDPRVQNTIWPSPGNGPQYALMGYMPYELMISQQFPWFGTLRLRGQAAEQEVRAALFALAAAQLEVVAEVKRSYYDLSFNQRAEAILTENRALADDIVMISRVRYAAGGSQQDVLRAEVAVTAIDRELVTVRQDLAAARARLAEQLHVSPEADLRALPELPTSDVPVEVDRLYRLAAASRPELQERLAEVARDEREVELARKRYYPDIDLGIAYGLMTRENNPSPQADGRDNVGVTVGFNLPIYRTKLNAAVCEARARTVAAARRYDAQRDRTYREVKDLAAQVRARREAIDLLQSGILPKSRAALELAASGYRVATLDFLTLNTARQEVLQIELQIARLEAELGKALASLERVVGVQLNEHPPVREPRPSAPRPSEPPSETPSPFQPGSRPDESREEKLPNGDDRSLPDSEGR